MSSPFIIVRRTSCNCLNAVSSLTLLGSAQNLPFTAKQKRTYQRLLSGITRASNAGHTLRVLTLTSPPDHPRTPEGGQLLTKRFQVLRKSIVRKYGYLLEYCRVRTDEGFGVLHVVYRAGKKGYIPHSWLKREWERIHGAKIVFIQKLYGKNKRIAGYLASHYLSRHRHFMRTSWSWGWCFRGFVGVWESIRARADSLSDAIVEWNTLLRYRNPREFYKEHRKKKKWRRGLSIIPLTRYHGFQ